MYVYSFHFISRARPYMTWYRNVKRKQQTALNEPTTFLCEKMKKTSNRTYPLYMNISLHRIPLIPSRHVRVNKIICHTYQPTRTQHQMKIASGARHGTTRRDKKMDASHYHDALRIGSGAMPDPLKILGKAQHHAVVSCRRPATFSWARGSAAVRPYQCWGAR